MKSDKDRVLSQMQVLREHIDSQVEPDCCGDAPPPLNAIDCMSYLCNMAADATNAVGSILYALTADKRAVQATAKNGQLQLISLACACVVTAAALDDVGDFVAIQQLLKANASQRE